MKYLLLTALSLLACSQVLYAQHTFSIVAIDPVTREVGSAGATCLGGPSASDGAYVIKDVVPNVGAVNSQSYYIPANQRIANERLLAGDDAESVLTYVVANDVQGRPGLRQYGAVTINDSGTVDSDAYTGADCFDYAGHRVGADYAIQGNILLGPEILDSMEARYIRAEGQSLGDRLMAAMQGANVPGADIRCLSQGVSSLSAYLTVAGPTNEADNYDIDIVIPQSGARDPIDVLQEQYDRVVSTSNGPSSDIVKVYPNPCEDDLYIDLLGQSDIVIKLFSINGSAVMEIRSKTQQSRVDVSDLSSGIYWLAIEGKDIHHHQKILIK